MFTTFKATMSRSSAAASAARLLVGVCLLGLTSASAAVQVFSLNAGLADGATISGTLSIDTAGNSNTALTAANLTISAPIGVTCGSAINFQGAAGAAGYFFNLACSSGSLMLVLNTPLSGGGFLNGYTGGTVNFSQPTDSFYTPPASANVQVTSGTVSGLAAPSFTKAFGAPAIGVGGTTSMTFTITNPNASAISNLAFTDTLPAGIQNVLASLVGPCGGTATATLTTIGLTGGTLAAGASCTISINVTGVTPGTDVNTTSSLTSNAPTAAAATATIVVTNPPTFSKAFGATTIFAGTTTSLTFSIANPNTVPLTGVAFTDTLPTGLVVGNTPGVTSTCGGTVTAAAGSHSISLSGGTIAASSNCTISLTVAGISPGPQNNTTSTLTSNQTAPAPAATASIMVFTALDGSFQVSYAADPAAGESYINIINTGANGASLLGPGFGTQAGNMCVNVYAFAPDEQEISCCSCLLTPNSVANLGVNRDLTSKTLTGVIPTSVVIKLVATLAGTGGSGTSCTAAAAAEGTLANGLVAYGTTPQPVGTTFSAVEHTFVPSTLSAAEYASITGRCASILGNGSGFGICNSCRAGALGADKQ